MEQYAVILELIDFYKVSLIDLCQYIYHIWFHSEKVFIIIDFFFLLFAHNQYIKSNSYNLFTTKHICHFQPIIYNSDIDYQSIDKFHTVEIFTIVFHMLPIFDYVW